ncbi:Agmatine deiminase [hydrothermal vent metagenome]|uniref:Agmatine deiminase n=1 Tax=hydrothermal vent metagenome TaxID=652676 RepID=A0A1W1CJF1_9ZZZZ
MKSIPAEWEQQSSILMAFPHKYTDWYDSADENTLKEALSVFIRMAQAIAYGEAVFILCENKIETASLFCSTRNLSFIEIPTNDTWIRDYGYLSVREDNKIKLLDFTFDAWGGKFEASLDNAVNQKLHQKGYMGTTPLESIDFVLEGGAIESDGRGTILTTSSCLCRRNGGLDKKSIEKKLEDYLGAKRVLWLNHGYLAGDDTDGHIDTLARFLDKDTIAYLKCEEVEDEHYQALLAMEKEIKAFRTLEDKAYNLIVLPMTKAIYNKEGQRLPATYLNFLITNTAVLYPTYKDKNDKIVHEILKDFFVDKEIIPINCLKLIEQGGSLHCSTMQVHH